MTDHEPQPDDPGGHGPPPPPAGGPTGGGPPPPPGSWPAAPPPPPPPPPAWGAGYGGTGAAAPFSVGASVSYGWNAFWKNVGPVVGITIVIFVVNVVGSALGRLSDNVVFGVVMSLIGWLVGLLLSLGLIRASLAVTRGEKPEVGMLFQTDGFGPYVVASILFEIGVLIGLALCIVPGIIFGVIFMFYGYVIAENPDSASPTDALRRSADITRGHRWELFALGLIVLLINIVGVLACLVGLVFTYGISAIAIAYAYRSLSGAPVVQPR